MSDKLLKSFEALRGHYNQVNLIGQLASTGAESSPVSQRKKDFLLSSKERITLCSSISDFLPFQSIRETQAFPSLLSGSIELLFQACDDADADVRLMAGEALNKIIKALLESNIGRIQVEFYKEIKKNGPARSLRAAIQRFAETCHMIRPQKCRPYLANLLPCVVKIAKRDEDTIQEILGTLMTKICPVLGKFMREVDVKILLKSFIPNLKCESAMKRRTAATTLDSICFNSRNPSRFYSWLLNVLLGMVVPLTDSMSPATLLGVLICFRHIVPQVGDSKDGKDAMKGSFGASASTPNEKDNTPMDVDDSKLLKVYEVTMFCTKHSDHNVVNAALESLSQILQAKPAGLLHILLSPRGISPTVTNASTLGEVTFGSEMHLDVLGHYASDSGLEEDSQASSGGLLRESLSSVSLESSTRSKDSAVGDISEISGGVSSEVQSEASTDSEEGDADETAEEETEEDGLTLPSSYTDGGFVNIGEEDVSRVTRLESVTSISDIPENENEEVDLEEMERMMSITSYDAKEAIERYFNIDAIACTGVPMLHCVRLMCSFLLAGKVGKVLPDSRTRVSVKSLTLNCLGQALSIYPEAFIARVMPEETGDATQSDQGGNSEQCVRDCCLFVEHSDPQIRGMIASVAGVFIKAALCKSGGTYGEWASQIAKKYSTDMLRLENVIGVFKTILDDDSSISLKIACAAVKEFIVQLFESSYFKFAYEIILKILSLKNNPYWLFKVEVLASFSVLDFRLVNLVEARYLASQSQSFTGYRISSVQNRCIEAILGYLGDEDARVRQAASKAIVSMIVNLDFESTSSKDSPQRVVKFKDLRCTINCTTKTMDVVEIHGKYRKLLDSNLAFVIRKLLKNLNYSTTKFLTHGCCQAMALLAETYPVSLSPLAWELYPKCKVSFQSVPNERNIRPIGPTRKLFFDDDISLYPGPLRVVLSLLTSSWITLDLQAHQEILKLAVNLLCGSSASYVRQIAQERKESGMTEDDETFGTMKDERWPMLKDQQLNLIATNLFHHTVRLLCVCTHVIEQTNPAASSSKLPLSFAGKDKDKSMSASSSPSQGSSPGGASPQSTPVTTSPRKFLLNKNLQKKAMSDQSLMASGDKSAHRKVSDGTSPQTTSESRQDTSSASEKLGHFHTIPHMMKLYETAKGAFKTYQVTSISKKGEKFKSFVRGVLEAFGLQLELTSFGEVGNAADEFLEYLMSCVKIDAEQTFLAVQQLLKSLFGTNVAGQPDMYHLPYSTKHLIETRGDPTFSLDAAATEPLREEKPPLQQPGTLYDMLIKRPCESFEEALQAGRQVEQGSQDVIKKARASTLSFFKKFKKIATPQKPVSKLSKEKLSSIQSYIRLFEPLVIHALKTYTMTSNLDIQAQVIHLLDQLIRLRVNYSLLDADQIFIAFVLKQFEFVEAGQIGNPSVVIPEMFQFLVLLSYDCFQPKYSQAKSIIVMPQIIQLCDGIMACGQQPTTHAIPALKPVVQDLFISKNQVRADSTKELDTQREVAFRMLLRLTQYPEVLKLLSVVLEGSKEDEEKWKRFSRQIVDAVFPQLSKLQVNLDCEAHIEVFNKLLDSLAPIALRPADVILKAIFAPVQIKSLYDTLKWLCMVLGLGRILITQNNEEIMQSRLLQLGLSRQRPCNLVVVGDGGQRTQGTKAADTEPAEFYAQFFIHAVSVASEELKQHIYSTVCNKSHLVSLEKLTQMLLILLSTVLKSERFKGIALAASCYLQRLGTSPEQNGTSPINSISATLIELRQCCPTLLLHWCVVLQLLGYEDAAFWESLLTDEAATDPNTGWNWTSDITSNGSLLVYSSLLADLYKKNSGKGYNSLLCSLLNAKLRDLIEFSGERPVKKLLSKIYEESDLSGIFLQYISQLFENQSENRKFLERKALMGCLENVHANQSTLLLQLLLTKLPAIRSYGIARFAETIACKRLEYLRNLPANEKLRQLPENDLQRFVSCKDNTARFPRLITLINKCLSRAQPDDIETRLRSASHPLDDVSVNLEDYVTTKEWFLDFVKKISSPSMKKNSEDISCIAMLLISLDPDNISDLLPDLALELFHVFLTLAVKTALDEKSIYLEEVTQSMDVSSNPDRKKMQRLLLSCKTYLLKRITKVTQACITFKEPSRVSFLEEDGAELSSEKSEDASQAHLNVQKFTLIKPGSVESLSSDFGWKKNLVTLCKCVREFLAPSCYWNKHWKLSREDSATLFEFSFVALRSCVISSSKKDSLIFSDFMACMDCLSTVLHSREFRNVVGQEISAKLIAHGIDDVYFLVSAVNLDPGEILADEVTSCQEHTPFARDTSIYARSCHQVSEMVHTLRTHFSLASSKSTSIPLAVVHSLRQVIIALARLPLVNSFVRVPPVVWKLGWQPALEGPFKTELPPLPVEILKEKDVLREFIFRANAMGWISRAQFEETWAALLGVLSSPPMSEDASVEDDIEATQASCLAVHCITSLVLYTTLAPVPGSPAVSQFSMIPRQKEYPFLGSRIGKRLAYIRKRIEIQFKEGNQISSNKPPFSSSQFLYPVVPSLIFEKQRKQVLQRGCFMEERLYSSNLENSQSLSSYTLGQISASAIRTRLVSSDVQEDSDSDDAEALIIEINEEDPRKRFQELDIRSCLQFLLELFEQWLSPFVIPKTPLMLKTEAVKSLCLLSDLLLEMSHFEWILGVLLEFYQSNPSEDDITSEYIVPTICKALAVLRVEGGIAERISRIIENALKSPHVPLQISALEGGLYLLESRVPSTNMILVPILTDYLTKHIVNPVDAIQVISQRFCGFVWSSAFYIMEMCSAEIHDITFTSIVVETCIALLSSNEVQVPPPIASLLFRGLERLIVSFTIGRSSCDRLAKMAQTRLQSDNPDCMVSALGLLCTCIYAGKEGEENSGSPNFNDSQNAMIVDSQLIMMERLGVLFTRMRKGSAAEASLVAKILPSMLLDFLPVQEVMNKIFSEFLSSQQPHPELIAKIAFEVFDELNRQGQQDAVRNWIILSLGSFIQRTPLSMAIWSLSCFLVSGTMNPWLQSLFAYILSRKGNLELEDRRIFCIIGLDFYQNQIMEPDEKRMFLSTFQRKSAEVGVYQELVECCLLVDKNFKE